MNLNTDQQISFIQTIDDTLVKGALSYTLPQDSYNSVKVEITCANTLTGDMYTTFISPLVQRSKASSRSVASLNAPVKNGDVSLGGASVGTEIIGASLIVNVQGVANTVLQWAIKLTIDKFTTA
jgi:hypothetical protein